MLRRLLVPASIAAATMARGGETQDLAAEMLDPLDMKNNLQ